LRPPKPPPSRSLSSLPTKELQSLPPFPDGTPLVLELTRPAIASLAANSAIPNVLLSAVDSIIVKESDEPAAVDLKELAELYFGILRACVTDPEPVEDVVTWAQADWLWYWLIEGSRSLTTFVQSAKFFSFTLTCKRWGQTPSEALHIHDEYTAFCLDEAAAYLHSQVEAGMETDYLHEANEREKDKMHNASMEAAMARIRAREARENK